MNTVILILIVYKLRIINYDPNLFMIIFVFISSKIDIIIINIFILYNYNINSQQLSILYIVYLKNPKFSTHEKVHFNSVLIFIYFICIFLTWAAAYNDEYNRK